MSITLEPFELRNLILEDRRLTIKAVLMELSLYTSTITQAQAKRRGATREWLERMEGKGVLKRMKRGTASNSKVEYDLLQFEEVFKNYMGSHHTKSK